MAPESARARMKYLDKQLKTTKAVAEILGVSRRTVERYVAGKSKRLRKDLAGRIERQAKQPWRPRIRAKARKKAASADGLAVSTRARFGFTPAPVIDHRGAASPKPHSTEATQHRGSDHDGDI